MQLVKHVENDLKCVIFTLLDLLKTYVNQICKNVYFFNECNEIFIYEKNIYNYQLIFGFFTK